ncbi:MAG TPA: FAD/NAD(P)-binding oxidoreductase [Solirubrobacteraceae bacterium]|jgi:NADPH-dependent 2,4-dienoyl-CoA reductase/sulfur reductase-like enzyme|nr:FAD/NAD(P)-binding oxidoreductase [Solirubrobacteraceae bacterium]
MTAVTRSVLIVGASAAGISVAGGLRAGGYDGAITLLGEESELPYDRPPLTKQLLSGAWERERTLLLPGSRLAALDAQFILGRRAVGLDVCAHIVIADDGTEHPYDALVIATGAAPRTLPTAGLVGVHVMRTLADALALRRALEPHPRLVIVGAGFLGLEAAATARTLGATVTVVEPLTRPLAGRLGDHVADRLLALHEANGVEIHTGVGVARLVGATAVEAVELTDGRSLPADVVLVAIGCVPCTGWLEGSALTVDDGIVCDEYCSAGPDVWAAGDVARWWHVGAGRHVRVEHRTNASEQGSAVARAVLGERVPFDPVPFFWTDQYDVKIQMAGLMGDEPEVMMAEGATEQSFVQLFNDGGTVTSVLGWNAAREVTQRRRALNDQRPSRQITA